MTIESFLERYLPDPADEKRPSRRFEKEVEKHLERDVGGLIGQIPVTALSGIIEGVKMHYWRPAYIDLTPGTTLDSPKEAFLYHSGDFMDGALYTAVVQMGGQPLINTLKQYAAEKFGETSRWYRATDWCDRHFDAISTGIGIAAIVVGETIGQGGDTPDYKDMPAGFLGVMAVKGAQIAGRYIMRRRTERAPATA